VTHGGAAGRKIDTVRREFAGRLREEVPLSRHTSCRIGGPADYLLVVRSSHELADAARRLWGLDIPFRILGGGSNVLISDRGVRGVVVLNQGKQIRFRETEAGLRGWAESGASIGTLSRLAAERGWAGMEWGVSVPGTVGGALVGNAGAHGGDVAGSLDVAEILHRDGRVDSVPAEKMEFGYRQSWIKRRPGGAVVLSASFRLTPSSPDQVRARVAELVAQRQRTQPPGASLGSMFRNPPGDFAGRLIEDAGLMGVQRGAAQISTQHANFFLNRGGATAEDVWELIQEARRQVRAKSGVELELEIERVGEWETDGSEAK
jgi:UDP-N-acetylmuramate dehydrogenase